MSVTWQGPPPPQSPRIGPGGWLRVAVRGPVLAMVVFGGLVLLLLLRLVERPLCGLNRPVTPHITRWVCRGSFVIMGMTWRVTGRPMARRGAVVANHSSWLDIFALNAADTVYFVSKAEVAKWPGIGWLARATGTLFIRRNRHEAALHRDMFQQRLKAGHHLVFFPEGTSTDGSQVLPFKSTLFEAFLTDDLKRILHIQPVSILYTDPVGNGPRYYGWWGDMEFGAHLLKILATAPQGGVELIYHPPVAVADFSNRREIAQYLGDQVRSSFC
ncbi:lysophospholipid acyltransferase family protein [Oceaniglobus ichthyenteri]|uniref:lysophospholipid acyltransferase family protein n=1 Tax=Oceaniglobus ichthyenteri TaxID=2136177 RepID=UPI000D36FBB2|nr:lysophospholipid acyltransferase family protein [Oceaniglobus ichthyenteri]